MIHHKSTVGAKSHDGRAAGKKKQSEAVQQDFNRR